MEMDADNLSATELRLGLPGTSSSGSGADEARPKKRALDNAGSEASGTGPAAAAAGDGHDAAPPAKAQVVGWPPVRAYRKQNTGQAAAAAKKADQQQQQQPQPQSGLFVKVSMDGAPYLRKVDLRTCKGYRELRDALDALFATTTAGTEAGSGDRAVAYEDKDGDLMLAGDVPWDMFVSSCKKLRIIKGAADQAR